MDQNPITAMAGVLGSVSGASAANRHDVDFAEKPNNSRAGKVGNAQARNTLRRFHYGSIATARGRL